MFTFVTPGKYVKSRPVFPDPHCITSNCWSSMMIRIFWHLKGCFIGDFDVGWFEMIPKWFATWMVYSLYSIGFTSRGHCAYQPERITTPDLHPSVPSYHVSMWAVFNIEYRHTWAGNPILNQYFMECHFRFWTLTWFHQTYLGPPSTLKNLKSWVFCSNFLHSFASLQVPIPLPKGIPVWGWPLCPWQERRLFHRRRGPAESGPGQAAQRDRRGRCGGLHATLRRSDVAPQRHRWGMLGVRGLPWERKPGKMPWECHEMPWAGWFLLILRRWTSFFGRGGWSRFQRAQKGKPVRFGGPSAAYLATSKKQAHCRLNMVPSNRKKRVMFRGLINLMATLNLK